MPSPTFVKYWLRNHAAQGILQKLAGTIVGHPYKNYVTQAVENYEEVILQMVIDEYGLTQLPIINHMDTVAFCYYSLWNNSRKRLYP